MKKRYYVAIAAVSEEPNQVLLKNTDSFLEGLREHADRIVIVLGGYWGLMKYIADKAIELGFNVMFVLPDNPPLEPPNNDKTIIVRTDLGFPTRSTVMCKTGDVLVAMGGRIGSITEIMLAYDFRKPVVVVRSGYDTDKIPACFGEYIDARKKAKIMLADNGLEAARIVKEVFFL